MNHAVNWEAISAIGQIVGAVAVVISLIYLAREIRNNARSARLASVGTINRCLGQLASHPHLAEVWRRGIRDWESLKGPDNDTFHSFMLQLFHIFNEMYYEQLEGHLDPRLWREIETPMRDLISTWPGVQARWREYSRWFNEEFANYVNQLQQTAGPPRMYREGNPDQ
jgi:hypothetical protein